MSTELTVFAGPSISHEEVRELVEQRDPIIGLRLRPPAAAGDVLRELSDPPRVLVLIDGVYERVPAVWHKELLLAMHRGVQVVGAASMGALRAAELEPYGMVGVGAVLAQLRAGSLVCDDEVAVAHLDGEQHWRAVSEALVDIRATLGAARAAAVLTPRQAAILGEHARRLFYPERGWPRILAEAAAGADADQLRGFQAWLPTGRVSIKHRDARAAIETGLDLVAAGDVPAGQDQCAPPAPPMTSALRRALTEATAAQSAEQSEGFELEMVLDELRLDDDMLTVYRETLIRILVAGRWGPGSTTVPPHTRARLAAVLGLAEDSTEHVRAWERAVAARPGAFDRLAHQQGAVAAAYAEHDEQVRAAIPDQLRIRGTWGAVRDRVLAKQAAVREQPRSDPDVAWAWWCEHAPGPDGLAAPRDPDSEAARRGFSDTASFLRALVREHALCALPA